jgi:hypothetical protein
MSDETTRLHLAQLVSLQELNAVTWNEALAGIDTLVDLCLLGTSVNTPPASPADGDAYLVGANPTGAWLGSAYKIAACSDGTWRFLVPFKGLIAFVPSTPDFLVFNGAAWVSMASLLLLQNLAALGINCSADATNKLAVAASSVLFNNAGNGVQMKLNKNAAADTASLLYQTGWSGRAEVGLCGNDDFHFKTSPDGAVWREALVLKADSGRLGLNTAAPSAPLELHVDGASPTASALAGANDVIVTKQSASAAFGGIVAANTSSDRMVFSGIRARGTLAAPAAVAAGDGIFSLLGAGYDGATPRETAAISFTIDGAVSAGTVPQRITFETGTGSTRSERVRINATGELGVGKTATAGVMLDVAGPVGHQTYTVAALPNAAQPGQVIFVGNESGGAVLAFSDGTNWRRVTDRAVVS